MEPDNSPRRLPDACDASFGHVDITEIQGRDLGSLLHPLECKGSDGERYFVKTRRSDMRPLVCEWICGRLAQHLMLPLPSIRLAWLCEDLVQECRFNEYDLVPGWGFASRAVPFADGFPKAVAGEISLDDRIRLLAFDHWIHNADRRDANPNLLWQASETKLWLIDHHDTLADAPVRSVKESHIFREDWDTAWEPSRKEHLMEWLDSSLPTLPFIISELPVSWKESESMLLGTLAGLLARTLP